MRTPQEIREAFDDRSKLDGCTSFALVGIGGAGMSGVAHMLKNRGFQVKGTDLTDSHVVQSLRELGISVTIGHTADIVSVGDAVVLSDAIPLATSPEYRRAKELGCPVFRRSQALGWLLKDKKLIAVTGTHGKTTTTGMIGAGLIAAGMDPTIVVGAEVPQFGGSVVEGKGDWAVVEACEAYDSFHDFDPTIVVLTNLELDHVDYHGTWENLKESVKRFVNKLPADGQFVFNTEDRGANSIAGALGRRPLEIANLPKVIHEAQPELLVGRHNRSNARLAIEAIFHAFDLTGRATGESQSAKSFLPMIRAVTEFGGAERRLQILQKGSIDVIDDYAHHPTEIRASIQALREMYPVRGFSVQGGDQQDIDLMNKATKEGLPYRRLVVVYQPHLYSRTKDLIDDFAHALEQADHVFLTDIYPAREDPIPGISSLRIAEKMTKPVTYVPSRHLLPREVAKFTKKGDVVVGMGAGNIDAFAPAFIEELNRKGKKIAVVYGGDSAEREVSILSGRAVHKALEELGYDATLVDVTDLLLNKADVSFFKGSGRPDLAFLCVHGTRAEDGAIQGFFELMHVPYTGSGIQASAIAMDKQMTKTVISASGLPVPKGVLLTEGEGERVILSPVEGRAPLPPLPLIVKPNAQGSTVGLSFVEKQEDLQRAIEQAFAYDKEILIEEWVKGIEVSVPVASDQALPVVEIVPASGRYDFESKYTPGATEEICPARLTPEQTKICEELALKAHQTLGCKGVTRTDMIVAPDRIVILEVNTLPGMTPTSLVPRSALAHGWSFNQLVEWMVTDGLAKAQT